MKYLGVDYGNKRVGVAVSDEHGKIAFPKKTFYHRGNKFLIDELRAFLKTEEIARVVVGIPVGLDGKDTEYTKTVREFAEKLHESIKLPVEFENEMLTTHMVEGVGVPKEHTDESAAAVILQSYLDKQNNK